MVAFSDLTKNIWFERKTKTFFSVFESFLKLNRGVLFQYCQRRLLRYPSTSSTASLNWFWSQDEKYFLWNKKRGNYSCFGLFSQTKQGGVLFWWQTDRQTDQVDFFFWFWIRPGLRPEKIFLRTVLGNKKLFKYCKNALGYDGLFFFSRKFSCTFLKGGSLKRISEIHAMLVINFFCFGGFRRCDN